MIVGSTRNAKTNPAGPAAEDEARALGRAGEDGLDPGGGKIEGHAPRLHPQEERAEERLEREAPQHRAQRDRTATLGHHESDAENDDTPEQALPPSKVIHDKILEHVEAEHVGAIWTPAAADEPVTRQSRMGASRTIRTPGGVRRRSEEAFAAPRDGDSAEPVIGVRERAAGAGRVPLRYGRP
jgi:hypothetical protein